MHLPALMPPALPVPSSWFPGHMRKFTRMLPNLLAKTDVVLELRDARLPLTSINGSLQAAVRKWRAERGWHPNDGAVMGKPCEHIVVFNKRDLVPSWGIEPFRRAMATKFPEQTTIFASYNQPGDIKELNSHLVNIAKRHEHAVELNVLVVGMPNVGKSTLLNTLRHFGIKGPTAKAFRTSANPGHTQAVSTRLRLSLDPLIYAYDSPGVMLPFLGRGPEGAERGVKLALIAGIKEGLYDMDSLAAYLLYRFNILNPICPAYLDLLPSGTKPTADLAVFLDLLARRMGMLRRGAEPDLDRAAVHFVRWWRSGGALPSLNPTHRSASRGLTRGWGFDCEWTNDQDSPTIGRESPDSVLTPSPRNDDDRMVLWDDAMIQTKMEECIDRHLNALELEEASENNVSPTQEKKQAVAELKKKRALRYKQKR